MFCLKSFLECIIDLVCFFANFVTRSNYMSFLDMTPFCLGLGFAQVAKRIVQLRPELSLSVGSINKLLLIGLNVKYVTLEKLADSKPLFVRVQDKQPCDTHSLYLGKDVRRSIRCELLPGNTQSDQEVSLGQYRRLCEYSLS